MTTPHPKKIVFLVDSPDCSPERIKEVLRVAAGLLPWGGVEIIAGFRGAASNVLINCLDPGSGLLDAREYFDQILEYHGQLLQVDETPNPTTPPNPHRALPSVSPDRMHACIAAADSFLRF